MFMVICYAVACWAVDGEMKQAWWKVSDCPAQGTPPRSFQAAKASSAQQDCYSQVSTAWAWEHPSRARGPAELSLCSLIELGDPLQIPLSLHLKSFISVSLVGSHLVNGVQDTAIQHS